MQFQSSASCPVHEAITDFKLKGNTNCVYFVGFLFVCLGWFYFKKLFLLNIYIVIHDSLQCDRKLNLF